MNLVTLTQVKRYLGLATSFTDDDALLQRLIVEAEEWAQRAMQRDLKPLIETRRFDWTPYFELRFNDDLLELITVTNGDSTSISLSDLAYIPRHMYPKYGVKITTGASSFWDYNTQIENAISLNGAWGYHDDWARAWIDSQDKVLDALGITNSVTSITVANSNGANLENDAPRLSIGMLIKIDSEWLEVTNITSTTTLTVVRGARGSTAAAHLLNAPIYTFKPARAVSGAITAYCHWRYHQKDRRQDYGNEVPADVAGLLPAPQGAYL